MSGHRRHSGTAETQLSVDDVSTALIRHGVAFAKRHYVMTSAYIVGVVIMLFAGGFAVSMEQEQKYERILSQIDLKRMHRAQVAAQNAEYNYRESKGWFSCDNHCMANYEEYQLNLARLAEVEKEFAEIQSEAKSVVGVFSEYGVQEVRDLFWSQFAGGKDFAKRSSWWDLIFMSIGSMGRDESLMEFALRFLMNMLMNFTIGLVGALIGFYWFVWGIITSYQPSVLIAFVFFMLASIAATSCVVSFLLGLYSAAAGSVYVAAKIASNSARLQDQQRRQQEYLRSGGRPHYE